MKLRGTSVIRFRNATVPFYLGDRRVFLGYRNRGTFAYSGRLRGELNGENVRLKRTTLLNRVRFLLADELRVWRRIAEPATIPKSPLDDDTRLVSSDVPFIRNRRTSVGR